MTIFAIWRLPDARPFLLIDAPDAERAIDYVAEADTVRVLLTHGYWNSEDCYVALPADPHQVAAWAAANLDSIVKTDGNASDESGATPRHILFLASPDYP
jgi:hypothetical protein